MSASGMTVDVRRLAQKLIGFPSVNPMGRELPEAIVGEHRVTAYLESFFRRLGVAFEIQPVLPGRQNIVARCDFPGVRKTILFEVHQDTVPVDRMTIDPFAGKIEGDRLYGRGACDVKGGMAAMLAAFARLVRDQPPKAANVILACTVDEEHTFLGVQHLVKQEVRAHMAIVAEPTQLQIVSSHKGAVRWHLTTTGKSCHSSAPEKGINAIFRMAKILGVLQRHAENLKKTPPHPELGLPTLSVGTIKGGTSVNTVPDFCQIEIDRRLLPGEDAIEARASLQVDVAWEPGMDFPVEISPPFLCCPALSSDKSKDLVARLGAVIDSVLGSHQVLAVPYGTDASTLAAAGIPSVVFGPGDIAQAHTADEWIDLCQVEQAAEILYRFASTAGVD